MRLLLNIDIWIDVDTWMLCSTQKRGNRKVPHFPLLNSSPKRFHWLNSSINIGSNLDWKQMQRRGIYMESRAEAKASHQRSPLVTEVSALDSSFCRNSWRTRPPAWRHQDAISASSSSRSACGVTRMSKYAAISDGTTFTCTPPWTQTSRRRPAFSDGLTKTGHLTRYHIVDTLMSLIT